jgi:DNA (cytosine-5)-methyltransferase 1
MIVSRHPTRHECETHPEAGLIDSESNPGDTGISAVDLFCGVGGLTHGLQRARIPVVAGIDIDPTCRYPFVKNNGSKFIYKDIGGIPSYDVQELFPIGDVRILVGCPPCQPFSNYTLKNKNRKYDEKWSLLYAFARIIRSIEPDLISMENVPQIRDKKPFRNLLRVLERMRYHVWFQNVKCELYGIPQRRTRLVLIASKYGRISLNPPETNPSDCKTVRDAIGFLEPLECGGCSKTDPLHRAQNLSPLNRERLTQSKPGGTWKDWNPELVSRCHRKKGGKSFYTIYGRMTWDEPSPTITTQFYNYGSGRFGHPEQLRALSLREGALLQSFPIEYEFIEPGGKLLFNNIGKLVGNAVPVVLGEVIGKTFMEHTD